MAWYDYPVTHGYSTTISGPDTPHFAEDIGTPFHTPLTSLFSGTVQKADFKPWGGEVFIEPDFGGPQEYFYHLDTINVRQGQHIDTNTMLGLSGGENPGYPGAQHPAQSQYSTGPHTHVGFYDKYYTGPYEGLGGRTYTTTIPEGPDISQFVTAKAGKPVSIVPSTSDVLSQPQGCSLGDFQCYANALTTQWGGQLGVESPADLLYRTGFILGGVVLIIVGLVILIRSFSPSVDIGV